MYHFQKASFMVFEKHCFTFAQGLTAFLIIYQDNRNHLLELRHQKMGRPMIHSYWPFRVFFETPIHLLLTSVEWENVVSSYRTLDLLLYNHYSFSLSVQFIIGSLTLSFKVSLHDLVFINNNYIVDHCNTIFIDQTVSQNNGTA